MKMVVVKGRKTLPAEPLMIFSSRDTPPPPHLPVKCSSLSLTHWLSVFIYSVPPSAPPFPPWSFLEIYPYPFLYSSITRPRLSSGVEGANLSVSQSVPLVTVSFGVGAKPTSILPSSFYPAPHCSLSPLLIPWQQATYWPLDLLLSFFFFFCLALKGHTEFGGEGGGVE